VRVAERGSFTAGGALDSGAVGTGGETLDPGTVGTGGGALDPGLAPEVPGCKAAAALVHVCSQDAGAKHS
jgi:hypothetical protein